MLRSLARPLAASALLLAGAAVLPARAQDAIRLASPAAAGKVRHIDFSDWLNAQGTSLVTWAATEGPQPNLPFTNVAAVDYAGKVAALYGLSLGFSATGTVKVTRLADGTGEVLVNVNFENALTVVANRSGATIFGYRADLVAGGAPAALSTGHLQVKYVVPDAANPALDLLQVLFNPAVSRVVQVKFHSDGEGPLRAAFGVPEGTPGSCVVAQNGLYNTGGGGATADGWPVEHVEVRELGGDEAVSASPTASGSSTRSLRRAGSYSGQPEGEVARPVVSGSWGQIKALYR